MEKTLWEAYADALLKRVSEDVADGKGLCRSSIVEVGLVFDLERKIINDSLPKKEPATGGPLPKKPLEFFGIDLASSDDKTAIFLREGEKIELKPQASHSIKLNAKLSEADQKKFIELLRGAGVVRGLRPEARKQFCDQYMQQPIPDFHPKPRTEYTYRGWAIEIDHDAINDTYLVVNINNGGKGAPSYIKMKRTDRYLIEKQLQRFLDMVIVAVAMHKPNKPLAYEFEIIDGDANSVRGVCAFVTGHSKRFGASYSHRWDRLTEAKSFVSFIEELQDNHAT